MKDNVGLIDMVVRLIVATVLLLLVVAGVVSGATAILLVVLATVLLITALFGYCPLYRLFGWNTCRRNSN